jgi:hypothetical protein
VESGAAMKHLKVDSTRAFCILLFLGNSAYAAGVPWHASRTEYDYPDLQGVWTNATITPLERPAEFGNRQALTDAEAQKLERNEASFNDEANAPTDPKVKTQDLPAACGKGFVGADCGYNFFWIDSGTRVATYNGEKRSSLIVDPPNGKVPLLPERQKWLSQRMIAMRQNFDGPEARPLSERCILAFGSSSGPPMLPVLYNNHYQIVQNKDTVTILIEMVHDARIVRIGGQHLPSNMRKLMGDSIGRYEGDTLVVETTNFTDKENFRGATANLKVTERFTRVDPGTVNYKFIVEDPGAFSQPWSGEIPLHLTKDNIYEYACHEGNYALHGILAGARENEKSAAASK